MSSRAFDHTHYKFPVSPEPIYFKDLCELEQWVCWRYESEPGNPKPKKPPYGIDRKYAKPNDPGTWSLFEEVLEASKDTFFDGIGFVFSSEDEYCGIDLDNCIDADGYFKPWASEIAKEIDSACEISPSGTGIHFIVKGSLSGSGRKSDVDRDGNPVPEKSPQSDGAIEVYSQGRYFTVTGRALTEFPADINDAQNVIDKLEALLNGNKNRLKGSPFAGGLQEPIPIDPKERKRKKEEKQGKFERRKNVAQGGRHDYLNSLAASLRAKGWKVNNIVDEVRDANKNDLSSPKSDEELSGIIEWIINQQPPSPPPTDPHRPDSSSPPPSNPPPDDGVKTTLPKDDHEKRTPNDMAREILSKNLILTDGTGQIWQYTGKYWKPIAQGHLATIAMATDNHVYTTRARRSEVVDFVLDSVRQSEIPWRKLDEKEVPVNNGVVNIETSIVRPHKPSDYLEAVVPWDYHPSPPKLWLQCIDQWIGLGTKHDALQEFAGYCLLPHARYKKALFLQGESDCGKSQAGLVLKAILGDRNVCTLSIEQLQGERKRAIIVGKMLNLLTELPSDALIADGGFKQLISTGDPISIDPKYLTPFSYTPFCKHVIIANKLPAINDHSRATFNRLLLIKFPNVIPADRQDPQLFVKLMDEMPAILAWAVEGAARLVEREGRFTEIEESKEMMEEYRTDQNVMIQFLQENCSTEDTDCMIPSTEFWERFQKWNGKALSRQTVAGMLRPLGHEVKVRDYPSSTAHNRKSVRCVLGVRWLVDP